uniref:ITPR-interacting domain-containing protein n=1 Tax=Amphiprion ocellaris TaxID=80972 RepID=A0AAQ6AFL2_AMPOC
MLYCPFSCSSTMDKLNLWNDDPEEVLFDLGFGCDEPDLSSRIPTRFINYQSRARGINLQVFLDAQKSRLDLENPDVSSKSKF